MAVQKDRPYARPGERVTLNLLWSDANPLRQGQAPQIAWFALCENPASDLFELCFEQLANLGSSALDADAPNPPAELLERISLPSPSVEEANDEFSFVVSDDIISSRPRSPNGSGTPYGLTYVMFAACSGTLGFDPTVEFPVICYEDRDGQTGFGDGDRLLSSDDFVVGYSAVYSYLDYRNSNPGFDGLSFRGQALRLDGPVQEATSSRGRLTADDFCVGTDCSTAPSARPCPSQLTIPACVDNCPGWTIEPEIPQRSAEVDEVASALGSATLREQMWINYYTTGGKFESGDVKLLNDATTGWNSRHSAKLIAPGHGGTYFVWVVAHDNRGGTQWARLRLCVEE